MPEPLVVSNQIEIPASELRFTFARSSGPGGQNVNKLNTKARLCWSLGASTALPVAVRQRLIERFGSRVNEGGDFIVTSDRHREQARNTRDCLEKLRAMILSVATPPKPRRRTKPSRGSVEARLRAKRRQSQRKQHRRPPPSE